MTAASYTQVHDGAKGSTKRDRTPLEWALLDHHQRMTAAVKPLTGSVCVPLAYVRGYRDGLT